MLPLSVVVLRADKGFERLGVSFTPELNLSLLVQGSTICLALPLLLGFGSLETSLVLDFAWNRFGLPIGVNSRGDPWFAVKNPECCTCLVEEPGGDLLVIRGDTSFVVPVMAWVCTTVVGEFDINRAETGDPIAGTEICWVGSTFEKLIVIFDTFTRGFSTLFWPLEDPRL